MAQRIRLTPAAIADVVDIKTYISEDDPKVAADFASRVYTCIRSLSEFPKMGKLLRSKIGICSDYRFVICGKHLVLYKIEEDVISVYRVLSGLRDHVSILFEEELTESSR